MRLYSTRGYIDLKVAEYGVPIRGNISSSQTRTMVVHYPVSYIQGEMNLTVLTRSRGEARKIIKFLRAHQKDVQKDPANTLRIVNSKRGIDFRGVCPTVLDQRSLEEYAPKIQIPLLLTQDLLSEVTTSSSEGSRWDAIYEDGYQDNDYSAVVLEERNDSPGILPNTGAY